MHKSVMGPVRLFLILGLYLLYLREVIIVSPKHVIMKCSIQQGILIISKNDTVLVKVL